MLGIVVADGLLAQATAEMNQRYTVKSNYYQC
jgi:hypothetical protein